MTEPREPIIVYLDADDEITSAAARLRRVEGERVVFVLPYGSRLATSRINFRLLAREAASRDKRLEIVAPDASARALAGTAGLPVHASVAALEGQGSPEPEAAGPGPATPVGQPGAATAGAAASEWPVAPTVPGPKPDGTETRVLTIPGSAEPVPVVGRRRRLLQPRTTIVLALVLLLLVGGGGLAAFLYLPSATIVLHPASQAIGPLSLSIEARTDVSSPDPSSLVVPARRFTFDLSASQTFTTIGKKVTDTTAKGSVTFTWIGNQTGVTIRTGTQVATASGIAFLTDSSVTLKRARNGPQYASVSVTAVAAGTAGNVPAGTINRISPNQNYDPFLLSVTNPQPTSGGTHTETPQVSQQDIDAALATLRQALRDDLAAKVAAAAGVPQGTTLLESTGTVGTTTPTVDPTTLLGQEVATFDLGLSASGTVLGVDTAPVQSLAAGQVAARVSPGWQLVDGTTTIEVGRPTVSGDLISFSVTAAARQVRAVDRDALLAQIRGLDLPRARALLEGYGQVDISLWPDWVTTIPGDTNRILLTIDAGPSPSGTPPASS